MTPEREAIALLDEAADRHKASGVYAMFSGGDDSLACALVTAQAQQFRGCVHLDTGIGIEETRAYVRETCHQQGWPLWVYRAIDCGQDYAELCVAYGFPGPALHYRMYARLKERPLRAFIRAHKTHRHDRLILSTGARSHESERRMGHVQPERREGVKVWMNPLHLWRKLQSLDYIAARDVTRNPVVELLHMSGECLCGSFAKPDELHEIALWYPKTAASLRALEQRVQAAGQRACIWGVRPPKTKTKTKKDSAGRHRVSELCQQCELHLEHA
jgi:3'-phosphoadenosine 5'-phosphosulfate sulfotransferase (PAPS reductase)/FAD synthetase